MFTAWTIGFSARAAENGKEEKKEKGENEQILSFADDAVGALPAGWKAAETRGKGAMATWEVAEDPTSPSKGKVVTIAGNTNSGGAFSLLINQNVKIKNMELTMSLKALAGGEDQGGGPIWRVKDADNYYVARWNPLEDNLRLYVVKNGKRVQIAGTKIETDPKAWHTIKVENIGNHIEVYFDGKKKLEKDDATFADAGRVGYWIKADGRSSFDVMKVESE